MNGFFHGGLGAIAISYFTGIFVALYLVKKGIIKVKRKKC